MPGRINRLQKDSSGPTASPRRAHAAGVLAEGTGVHTEAAAFAHRATFIMRERPMGCPHRDRYYTKYAMTLVHSHHELMKRMYDALGHGEASVD